MATVKTKLNIDTDALKQIKLVAVAYSYVEREFFPTDDAYKAEKEVEGRAQEVIEEVTRYGKKYHYGLEAGSKPELIAALAYMHDPNAYTHV